MVTVFIEKEGRNEELSSEGTAAELCATVGVNPEEVLIVKDGTLITEGDSVKGAEKIELLSVISGG